MNPISGHTRTRVAARHALIAPDGHVPSVLPGVAGAVAVVLISERMGAGFTQLLLTFELGGVASAASDDTETFGYLMEGAASVSLGRVKKRLRAGGTFFAPAGTSWSLSSPSAGARVTLFQKRYELLPGTAEPAPRFGDATRVPGKPFLGDPGARLRTLLPETASFDMAVNLFTYRPGATLPFVETHIMEHGLIMLSGQGVYRLEDSWYPVAAGDVIWMAPYCSQWFAATGRTPASYLYYKDVNRPAR